jgi:hypothetical protein
VQYGTRVAHHPLVLELAKDYISMSDKYEQIIAQLKKENLHLSIKQSKRMYFSDNKEQCEVQTKKGKHRCKNPALKDVRCHPQGCINDMTTPDNQFFNVCTRHYKEHIAGKIFFKWND